MRARYNQSVANVKNYNIKSRDEHGSINDHIKEMMRGIRIREYRECYIIRIYLILKDYFIEMLIAKEIDRITFPSICFIPYNKIEGYPRINDMMFIIPKKYYRLIEENEIDYVHEAWINII